MIVIILFFFFKQKTAYEMRISDWSSDVCSSDLADAALIPASLRGYVQLALDQGLINARFTVTQGPYDLQPTLHAYFDPGKFVTRAAYAVAAGRYQATYQSAED